MEAGKCSWPCTQVGYKRYTHTAEWWLSSLPTVSRAQGAHAQYLNMSTICGHILRFVDFWEVNTASAGNKLLLNMFLKMLMHNYCFFSRLNISHYLATQILTEITASKHFLQPYVTSASLALEWKSKWSPIHFNVLMGCLSG